MIMELFLKQLEEKKDENKEVVMCGTKRTKQTTKLPTWELPEDDALVS